MSRGLGPRLRAELSSSVVTCSSALDFTFQQRWAPVLPCGPETRLLAELSSDAATCSSALDLASLLRWTLALPRVLWLWALPPCGECFGAATYRTAPSGLWTTGIKKGVATLDTQLGSHVSKARSHVTEAPARRADMPLQFGSTVQCRPS
jgi:hypothetical protein